MMLAPIFNLLMPGKPSSVQAQAVNAINMLILTQCACIREGMADYAMHIIGLYNQVPQELLLKQRIVQGITSISELEPEIILGKAFNQVLEVMLNALEERD